MDITDLLQTLEFRGYFSMKKCTKNNFYVTRSSTQLVHEIFVLNLTQFRHILLRQITKEI